MPPARKPAPGNPLWIKWLEEWEKEMAEKSEHMPKSIRKAIKSFEQCPVPIDHPANAVALRNVGEKTAQYLTKRLKAYCEETGLAMPKATSTNFEREAAKINKKKRKTDEAADDAPAASGSAAQAGSDSDNAEINTSPPKKPRKARPYAPRVRTGPWAILIGLASYGTGVWKSQAEITERADPFYGEDGQSLNDKATGGGAGSQFYTAWNSSKTLFTKGYLQKSSRSPVLYQITYEGWKIARKAVRNAKRNNDIDFEARRALPDFESEDEESEEDPSNAENLPVATTSSATNAKNPSQSRATGKSSVKKATEPASVNVASAASRRAADSRVPSPIDPAAPFLFYYLTEDNQRVLKQTQADMIICPDTYTTLTRIEFRQCQAKHIFAKKNVAGENIPVLRIGTNGPEGPTFSAYLRAKAALPLCSTFDSLWQLPKQPDSSSSLSPKRPSSSQSASQNKSIDRSKHAQNASVSSTVAGPSAAVTSTHASTSRAILTSTAEHVSRESSPDITELDEPSSMLPRDKILRAAEARAKQQSSPGPISLDVKGKGKAKEGDAVLARHRVDATPGPSVEEQDVLRSSIQMTATVDGHFIPDIDALKCETWAPESYDIRLIIDNREKPGLSSKKLERMLTDKGISWEARALSMGDAIWIARSKISKAEVVLDACLERKRLDDLLSSMRDGRYMEQKNRMVHSGMSTLIYLVEEHDTKTAMAKWGRQIWTMKSSLQIVDNFTVHIAWDTTDACNYLARLTRTFVDIFKQTTLTVLPDECIAKSHHIHFMEHLKAERTASTYVYSVERFQILNRKQHSLHTGWAKMVASINQMSLASTELMVRKWPTPHDFFQQLEATIMKDKETQLKMAEEEALDPFAKKRKKKDDPKIGECWIMREMAELAEEGESIRAIGQALSTHCWKLFASDKY